MGTFESFREGHWNTYYGSQRHAASYNVTHIVIAYFAAVVATCLLIYVISSRGKERWGALLRLTFNLHSAVSILLCLTGQNWTVAEINTSCEYTSSLSLYVQANVGLHIGLKDFNITLQAVNSSSSPVGDMFYNEEISFMDTDDSKSAAHAARHKGLPYAILHVLEYLEEDAGGLRWSRMYRISGHFVYIILWTSLVTWFVAQILTSFVVSRGAILNAVAGVLMVGACVLFHCLQPTSPLVVPFPDGFMELRYGWCLWLTCGSGILTLMYGIVILLVNFRFPACTAAVLLSDVAKDDCDESYVILPTPLQIMTPYQERKKKQHLYENYFTNDAFSSDSEVSPRDAEGMANRRHTFPCGPDRRPSDYAPNQSLDDTSVDLNQPKMDELWEIPPDYDTESDQDVELTEAVTPASEVAQESQI